MKYPQVLFFLFLLCPLEIARADEGPGLHWKAVLATGWATDRGQPIDNWETSRESLQLLLLSHGIQFGDLRILTARPSLVGTNSHGSTLGPMDSGALEAAVEGLQLGPGDGLILFLTSHGARDQGFCIEQPSGDYDVIGPSELRGLLDRTAVPAIVLISACFSGQFLGEKGVQAPNRVILTAAREDRSSFGCGVGSRLPEWDDSLIRAWEALPAEAGWIDLVLALDGDIARKEAGKASNKRSLPQASIGPAVAYLPRLSSVGLFPWSQDPPPH